MKLNTELNLKELVSLPNICEVLDEADLNTISYNVYKGFQADLESRSAWEKRTEEAMKLALQVAEAKSFPISSCSIELLFQTCRCRVTDSRTIGI
jgi:hypothetical protein